MANNLPPERGVPLPYGFNEIDSMVYGGAKGVQKFFEDPDFIRIHKDPEWKNGSFQIAWATELATASAAVGALDDFIRHSDFRKGALVLATDNSPAFLRGDAEDIVREVKYNDERVLSVDFENKNLIFGWNQSFGVDFHDMLPYEICLRAKKPRSLDRYTIDQCIAQTAMPGLRSCIDETLSQFAEYDLGLE